MLTLVVGPAIVAAVITYALNTRDERRRTLRDAITKSFEETRSDIRQAVSAGVGYFHCADSAKLPELAAAVLLQESDVRSGMVAIRRFCDVAASSDDGRLRSLEGDFLDALTGGDFEYRVEADPARARRIIGFGSQLRSELAKVRRAQLSNAGATAASDLSMGVLLLAAIALVYLAGFYAGWLLSM